MFVWKHVTINFVKEPLYIIHEKSSIQVRDIQFLINLFYYTVYSSSTIYATLDFVEIKIHPLFISFSCNVPRTWIKKEVSQRGSLIIMIKKRIHFLCVSYLDVSYYYNFNSYYRGGSERFYDKWTEVPLERVRLRWHSWLQKTRKRGISYKDNVFRIWHSTISVWHWRSIRGQVSKS